MRCDRPTAIPTNEPSSSILPIPAFSLVPRATLPEALCRFLASIFPPSLNRVE